MKKNYLLSSLNYLVGGVMTMLLALTSTSVNAQYATTHYIAPCPWYYFDQTNEIVVSTESVAAVNATISQSDGTFITTLSVSSGNPVRYRFTNPACGAGCTPAHVVNTLYAGRGIIVTAPAPVAVSIRNVESDQIGGGNSNFIKGNASLTSFGDQGPGIEFRLGYYRSNNAGLNAQGGSATGPVYSVMAINNNTQVFLNGANLVTLNAGESYIFQAAMGSLLESTKPVVANSGQWRDTPGGCGDGVSSQIFPVPIAGNTYLVVRGGGTATTTNTQLPEQSTIIATQGGGTTVTVNNYNATGGFINTVTYNLAAAGSFQSIFHGDGTNTYSSSYITSTKPVVVYSGTAAGCEVDMAMPPPLGGCTGSLRVETIKFRNYTNADLPYFGFVAVQSATVPVFLNGTNLETLSGNARFQIGTTGNYLIRFTNAQIGSPTNLVLTSTARMAASIVQQGGGFTMAGFYSSFNDTPIAPTVTGSGLCSSVILTAEPGLAPYQWYFEGDPIPGATGQTYVPLLPGNYSVAGTRACGTTAPSPNVNVICTGFCPANYEISTTSLVTNGNFAVQGAAVGGGITCAQSPASVNGTLNATSSFYSQAAHCTDGALATTDCNGTGRNQYSLMTGSYPLNNFGFSDLLNTFPGDPANNVPASNTYMYSNGNCYAGGEYLIWGQTLTGLTVGQSYTFYCYINNAIEPPANSVDDPIIRLRTGGAQTLPNGTVVAGPLSLSEAVCASTQPLGGWQRLSYTFSASTTSLVIKITSAATGTNGDDYQLTGIGFAPCRPLVTASSNSPVCQNTTLNLQATTSAAGTMTYAWSGPNGFTSTLQNPSIASASLAAAGVYTVTITDALGATNTATTTVVINAAPVVSFSINNATQCLGTNSFVFTNTSTAGSGTIPSNGYSWNFGTNATPASATTVGPHTVTYSQTGTSTVGLTVTNSNGCVASTSQTVTINQNPSVTITTPGTTICAGQSTRVLTANVTNCTGCTYQWTLGGSNIASATSSTYTATATGTYNVIVTNSSGCTATAAVNTIITANPTPTVTITSPATTICTGQTSQVLTANVTNCTGCTYQWTLGGANIASATSSTYTATATGTYNVIVTNSSGCTATAAANTVITANPTPTVSISSPATTICAGQTSQVLTANVTNCTGCTYQWTLGGSNIASATNATYTATATGTYNVIVTNSAGCTATATANTVITANPTPTVTITAPATTICTGQTSQVLTANVTNCTGCTYQWTLGGSNIASATSSTYTATATGTYNVIVTNSSGCTATAVANTIITANPTPTVTITSPATTICTGQTSQVLTANVTNCTGCTYQWTLGGANIASATSSTYTATATGTYNVIVTNSTGCTATAAANTVITANPTPSVSINSPATTICAGQTSQVLTANVTNCTGCTYQWTLGGSNIASATSATYTATATGTYNVIVTNSTGCTATAAANTVITANPTPTVTITTPGTTICAGQSTRVLTANVTNCTGCTYQWTLGGSNIASATSATYTATATGTYNVIVTNSSGCTATAAVNTVITANPTPTVTITSPATTICAGQSSQVLTANVTNCTGCTYQWTLGGSNIASATNATYTATATGTYNVIVTNSSGCTATAAVNTVITANPTPSVTISTPGTTICVGQSSRVLTANVTNCTGCTYQWTLGGSNIASATSATYTATAAGTYNVIVTNSAGCTATATANTVITANPTPTANAGPGATVTGTQTYTPATTTATGGNAPYTYLWSTSPVVTGNGATSSNPTFGPFTTTTTICVTVTSANGCTATSCATVTYASCPLAATLTSTTLAGGVNIACNGNTTGNITTAVTGNSGAITYVWSGPTAIPANTANPTNLAAGTYNVTISDAAGCIITRSITLTQPLPLTAGSCTDANDACQLGAGQIRIQAQGGTAPYSVAWTAAPVGSPLNQSSPQPIATNGGTVTFTGADGGAVYTFIITDSNGCQVP